MEIEMASRLEHFELSLSFSSHIQRFFIHSRNFILNQGYLCLTFNY
jgi:hypothetical protein